MNNEIIIKLDFEKNRKSIQEIVSQEKEKRTSKDTVRLLLSTALYCCNGGRVHAVDKKRQLGACSSYGTLSWTTYRRTIPGVIIYQVCTAVVVLYLLL